VGMIKKLFISIIAVIYLVVTTGMVVNIHYCMGKISSISFSHENDHKDGSCSKCGMNKTENHCCTDDVKYVKITDAHQSAQTDISEAGSVSTVPVFFISLNTALQGSAKEPLSYYFSPPPKTLNKVYKAVNTFLI
jgi:hypothetical protein